VRLSVLRDGQPREVVLTTGAAAEWPVPEQLESYLRQVIGD
jgi:hypothetical protein